MQSRARTSRPPKTKHASLSRCLAAFGFVAIVSLAPVTARAEDDDEKSIWNLDKRFIDEVIYSFGLTKKPKLDQQIDHQERPRLTVPPDRQLPAPAAVDPNLVRRQQKPKTDWREHDSDELFNPIHPSELRANSVAAAAPNRVGGDADPTDPLRPSQLGSPGGLFGGLFSGGKQQPQQQASAPTSEPPRRRLVDPPPGYQVPSPDQPYGGAARAGNNRPQPADHAVGDDQGL